MERKNISFSYGIRRSPSIGNEGELSECVNLIPTNGELMNIQPPKDLGIVLREDEKLLYIHSTSGYKNYIILRSDKIVALKDGDTYSKEFYTLNEELLKIESLGNTLIILTSSGVNYALYSSGEYILLGQRPPILPISFRLNGGVKTEDTISIMPEAGKDIEFPKDFNGNHIPGFIIGNSLDIVSNELNAKINTYITNATKGGSFLFPFFVRYAYRMYDGTIYMPSVPILMIPTNGRFPYLELYKNPFLPLEITPSYRIAELGYYIPNVEFYKSELNKWKDVISGVDIFISSQIWTFKQDGKFDTIDDIGYGVYPFGRPYPDTGFGIMGGTNLYQKKEFPDKNPYSPDGKLQIVGPTSSDFNTKIAETSLFYKVTSLKIDQLEESKTSIVSGDVLSVLETQERMDNYEEKNQSLIPKYSFVYNSRLNLANLKIKLEGFPVESMVTFSGNSGNSTGDIYNVYFVISSGEGNIVVKNSSSLRNIYNPYYLFYPDANTKQAIIEKISLSGWKTYATVPMKEHSFLSGSYCYYTTDRQFSSDFDTSILALDSVMEDPNKIYTSEVNNPFKFPIGGINTVGVGEIVGITSTTKALSQGQFGQFPLYVFSTDGIWALEVSNTGAYAAKQPVARDVCNNPDSITQIDSAIVFSTDQGLKLLQGSEVSLLSAVMDGQNIDESIFNVSEPFSSLFVPDTEHFVEMLKTCYIAYDYAHAMLHVFPGGNSIKHYVYSLNSGEFSSYVGYTPKSLASDYPQTVVQIEQKLYSFDSYVSDKHRQGVVITRPITFDDPFSIKIIHDLRALLHRTSRDSKIRIALFASNNLINWYRLPSMGQRSFKYHRFVLFTNMSDIDTLSGMGINFEYRRANKLR